MNHYALREDENLLWQGKVIRVGKKRENAELILTTLCMVLLIKSKGLFGKERIKKQVYNLNEIKKNKETPEIKRKAKIVEILTVKGEEKIQFYEKEDAKDFAKEALEQITGKGAVGRFFDKTKKGAITTATTLAGAVPAVIQAAATAKEIMDTVIKKK